MVKIKEDLTGKIFGRLTVIERVDDYIPEKGKPTPRWKCQCSCPDHNIKIVRGPDLKSGHTKSCGCLSREATIKNNKARKKNNTYIETPDGLLGFTEQGYQFLIDKEDYNKCKDFYWRPNKLGYLETSLNNKRIFLHRLVTNCPSGFVVDHINHNVADNRKLNLRVVTMSENTMNSRIRNDNSIQIKGVHKRKDCNMYEAHICKQGITYYLGLYRTLEEAIAVRKQAEKDLFGEYAYDEAKDANQSSIELTTLC